MKLAKILDIFSFQTAFSYQKIVELERSSNTFKRKKQDDEVACPKPTTDTHTSYQTRNKAAISCPFMAGRYLFTQEPSSGGLG